MVCAHIVVCVGGRAVTVRRLLVVGSEFHSRGLANYYPDIRYGPLGSPSAPSACCCKPQLISRFASAVKSQWPLFMQQPSSHISMHFMTPITCLVWSSIHLHLLWSSVKKSGTLSDKERRLELGGLHWAPVINVMQGQVSIVCVCIQRWCYSEVWGLCTGFDVTSQVGMSVEVVWK